MGKCTPIFWVALLALLSGCGEQIFNTTPEGKSPTDADVGLVELVASKSVLGTSPLDKVTITAYVKDADNRVLVGEPVDFVADSGNLVIVSGTTNASGAATATVSAGTDARNRTILVTATAGERSDTYAVAVTGTQLTVSGASSLVYGSSADLTIALKDSAGKGVSGYPIGITSKQGNTITTPNLTTDNNGAVVVTVTGTVGGTDQIVASALGLTATHSLNISSDQFLVKVPAEIPVDTCAAVTATWTKSGQAVVGSNVAFSASKGTLYTDSACTIQGFSAATNASGVARIYARSPNPGQIIVLADSQLPTGPSGSATGEFIAVLPARIEFKAEFDVLGTNQSTELRATVRDAKNNVVKGATVEFRVIEDPTGGAINPPVGETDSSGGATTVYKATAASSPLDGVKIEARIRGTAIAAETTLTVGQQALRITVQFGNTVSSVNQGADYLHYGTIRVTDSALKPVEGVSVSIRGEVESYDKGVRAFDGAATSNVGINAGVPTGVIFAQYNSLSCPNEDKNGNGILDEGEDVNGNGQLDPQSGVSVRADPETNENGEAAVVVAYPKDAANWTQVRVVASAKVEGTESKSSASFVLPMAMADALAPPGVVSPYKTGGACEVWP